MATGGVGNEIGEPVAEPGERVLFEGRWIEQALRQKLAEQLARRAFAEAEAHCRLEHGPKTRVAPFTARETVVTTLKEENSFLVIGRFQIPGEHAREFIYDVGRSSDGAWHVKQVQEEDKQ